MYECKINQQLKSRDPSVFRIRINQLLVFIQTKEYTVRTHIKFIQILPIYDSTYYMTAINVAMIPVVTWRMSKKENI